MALVQLLPFLMLAFAHSISLAVSSQKERCMIVSSADETQLLKVDLKFAKFEGQAITEGYRVVLHDTETHAEQVFQVQHGTFRKEFPLTQSISAPMQTSSTAFASKSCFRTIERSRAYSTITWL